MCLETMSQERLLRNQSAHPGEVVPPGTTSAVLHHWRPVKGQGTELPEGPERQVGVTGRQIWAR